MMLSQDEFRKIVNPLERPTKTWHCSFSYLENWLHCESEDIEHGVELIPDFQRGHVWTKKQQTNYIENVLRLIVDESGLTIRFNCPSWRKNRAKDSDLLDQMVCIDGLQRLTAIRRFIAGELKVFGLKFAQLPRRQIFRDLQIVVKMYDFQYKSDLLKFYLDINGGGIAHSRNEIKRVRTMLEKVLEENKADEK
ncbi:DUF262 domain-containing protein [Acinetobacter baumannii]|uniref:DUF262 domain-containing protein n=1 Tax=Acinetobacter baumannii TaxID=470 RepID=UPI003B83D80B